MKRKDLIRHLERYNCFLLREGAKHSVYKNLSNGKSTTVPRHRETKESLARKICDDLGVLRS